MPHQYGTKPARDPRPFHLRGYRFRGGRTYWEAFGDVLPAGAKPLPPIPANTTPPWDGVKNSQITPINPSAQ